MLIFGFTQKYEDYWLKLKLFIDEEMDGKPFLFPAVAQERERVAAR
jgi:hypothetical protein